jgi:serine/threonine protein kinase
VVAQLGIDGRQLAIFLKQLPRSLSRERYSSFSREDDMRILVDVSLGLSYIAGKGISHNDIKPGNIAYSPRRGAAILDFGLAGEVMTHGIPG